eukprot:gene6698-6921_t
MAQGQQVAGFAFIYVGNDQDQQLCPASLLYMQPVLAPEHLLVASYLPELLVEPYKRTTGMNP